MGQMQTQTPPLGPAQVHLPSKSITVCHYEVLTEH